MSVLLSIAIFAVGFVFSRHWKKVGMEMLKQNKKDLYQHCLEFHMILKRVVKREKE